MSSSSKFLKAGSQLTMKPKDLWQSPDLCFSSPSNYCMTIWFPVLNPLLLEIPRVVSVSCIKYRESERLLTLCIDNLWRPLCGLEWLSLWAQIQAHWFSEQNVSFATSDLCWDIKTLNACSPVPTKSKFTKHISEKDMLTLPSSDLLSFIPVI